VTTGQKPEPEAIRAQLARIFHSAEFRASDKQRKFLQFVVDETLEGRDSQLKGYTIAIEVYGRSEGFDPRVDPIVRVEAGRLRRALEHYYLTAGKNDPVHIGIPKGGNVPFFQMRQVPPSGPGTTISESSGNTPPDATSVAVIPLVDLTGDKDREYFTDGLTEELTSELARYQDFQVIASQSSMRFKGQSVDPREVGKDLNVRFLVTGSVRRDSNAVKVAVQLLDTSTSEQVWVESYKREYTPAELIGIQEDIARCVVGVIADQWGLIGRRLSRESSKKAPADMTTYDAVLRFYHYETELTAEAFEQALEALTRAIELEPEYGLAWSMLGHLHADNHALGFCEIDDPLEKALTFAKRGLVLERESQFAWDALAVVYFQIGDRERLLETVEKSIALNPNSPYIVGVSGWHIALFGEWDRGLELLKRGMKLNPYHPGWFHLVPFMDYFRRGDFDNALVEALNFNYPTLHWDPLMRAAALARLGRQEEASAAIKDLLELAPEFAATGRRLISSYVRVDDLVDELVMALREAGLADLE
jgi:adenylate cyclase